MGKGAIYASLPNFSEGTRHQLALVLSYPEQGKYCVTGMAYLNLSEENPMFPEGLREAGRPQACCLSSYHPPPSICLSHPGFLLGLYTSRGSFSHALPT